MKTTGVISTPGNSPGYKCPGTCSAEGAEQQKGGKFSISKQLTGKEIKIKK